MIQACDALDIIRKKTIVNQGPSIRGSHRHGYVNAESPVSRKVDAGFGGGRLETQVKLCAGRLSHFVAAFEYQHEAERFYKLLGQRLGKFGLELAADKTRIIPFDRTQSKTSFDFLGFEFRWGKDRAGKPHLKRRTAPKKLRKSIQSFTDWCKQNRHLKLKDLFRQLNAKLRGYYNYYGIYGNDKSLNRFFQQAMGILFKWLNRRSQRHSFNWNSFKQLLDRFKIERPHSRKQSKKRLAMGWA